MVSRGLFLLGIFPVVITAVWNVLDAAPTLFVYDWVASLTGGWQHLSLKDKTIWITGASSGIGAELVCQAIQAGAAHVVLSSRKRDKLEQVATRCKEESANALTYVSIVPYDAAAEENTADATVQSVLAMTGGTLDLVILNAGIYQVKPALQTTKQERDVITRVNYQSPVDLTEALVHYSPWKEQGSGHIVVVSSIMSHGPQSLSSAYAASKAALKSYFHSLSTEEYSWLRIDVACPGATDTSFWDNAHDNNSSQQIRSTNGMKMAPHRVAHLILTAACGPFALFYETWISKAGGLLWVWESQYTPNIFHASVHLLGYIRMRVWEHEQLDALDIPTLLHRLALILMSKYP